MWKWFSSMTTESYNLQYHVWWSKNGLVLWDNRTTDYLCRDA